MSSENLPPSGPWAGYYAYPDWNNRHRMQLYLTFSANGNIDGGGIDDIAPFAIHGIYDSATRAAKWTKAYIGMHSVDYQGVFDGLNILGNWSILRVSGAFRIWPGTAVEDIESAEEIEAPVELAEVKAGGMS
jgi:hypothetical protein